MRALVMTSIHGWNDRLDSWLPFVDEVFVALDEKSTGSYPEHVHLVDYESPLGPPNHYARKNLAYLAAIEAGADEILEIDDDNFLTKWAEPQYFHYLEGSNWVNVFSPYYGELTPRGWPRYPRRHSTPSILPYGQRETPPILNFVCEGDPDVDAITRLTDCRQHLARQDISVMLRPGQRCPFNSQHTLWKKEAFSYLFLPTNCSMRACDIFRSYRVLNAGIPVGWTSCTTVWQDRNEHDLLDDLQQEIEFYSGHSIDFDTGEWNGAYSRLCA